MSIGRAVFSAVALLAIGCIAPFASAAGTPRDKALKAFLRQELAPAERCFELRSPTAYSAAWFDLNGDGRPEAIVYPTGGGRCGTGGCGLLVLGQTRTGFRVRARTTISQLPIGVLETKSHGWRDLAVQVSGGGMRSFRAALSFDGRKYPSNPSVAPARPMSGHPAETILIGRQAYSRGEPLFAPARPPEPPVDSRDGVVTVSGRTVEIAMPEPSAQCWNWVNLGPTSEPAWLKYKTGEWRTETDGTRVHVWTYEAAASGRTSVEFALIPGWKNLYRREEQRAAAAKIYRADLVVP